MASEIKAPIPGTVWKILKKAGEQVSAAEVVVILESMKMEVPVEAPVAGTIAEIKCQENQTVDEGTVLATLA